MVQKIKVFDKDNRIRLVTFTIQCNDTIIDVDQVYTDQMLGKDGNPEDAFKLCKSLAKEGCCFYMLYDCHFETDEGIQKEELVFASWIPDNTSVKERMKYSSSRTSFKNCCKGVKHNLELNDITQLDSESFIECLEKLTPNIISVEGKAIPGKQRKCH